jgi:hypothetical protein
MLTNVNKYANPIALCAILWGYFADVNFLLQFNGHELNMTASQEPTQKNHSSLKIRKGCYCKGLSYKAVVHSHTVKGLSYQGLKLKQNL